MGLHLLTKYGWNHKIPIKGTTCDRLISFVQEVIMGEGGGRLLGSIFAGYLPLASQNPYPIICSTIDPISSHIW